MAEDIIETLEAMIDKHGLTHVVAGLALICFEKAEHLRSNWQDKATARLWDAEGKRLEKAARDIKAS